MRMLEIFWRSINALAASRSIAPDNNRPWAPKDPMDTNIADEVNLTFAISGCLETQFGFSH